MLLYNKVLYNDALAQVDKILLGNWVINRKSYPYSSDGSEPAVHPGHPRCALYDTTMHCDFKAELAMIHTADRSTWGIWYRHSPVL